jgi:hypothetical protein
MRLFVSTEEEEEEEEEENHQLAGWLAGWWSLPMLI